MYFGDDRALHKILILMVYWWAYGVVVSMFDFHRSDRGSNPDRGSKISAAPLASVWKP